jgi:hypothetical protein
MTELFVGMIFGMCLALVAVYVYLRMVMVRAAQNLDDLMQVIERLKESIIHARVEEEDGVFYVYNTADQSFMAQGTTVAEIRQRIEQRWQDVSVYVTEGDQDVIERLRGTAGPVQADRA